MKPESDNQKNKQLNYLCNVKCQKTKNKDAKLKLNTYKEN